VAVSDRRLVLVVGVGRSGTSLMSGMLGHLGYHIPQPEVKADDTNPRGFGEPRWVVDFHTKLLRQRAVTLNDARPSAWDDEAYETIVFPQIRQWLQDQLRQSGMLVIKDPRTVWFLGLWADAARDVGVDTSYVTMLRHPAEIVASARKSYGPGLTTAGRTSAWMNVLLQTELQTRGAPRAFVRYEDLLADWVPQIRRVGELIGDPALAAVEKAAHPDVDAFVDPTLHRSRVDWEELGVPARVRDLAEEVWAKVQRLAEPGGDTPAAAAALDEAHAAYRALYAEAEAVAQSTTMAARAREKAKANTSKPAPAAPPTLYVRIARRVPRRIRRALRPRS
jgi:hypothetical protein